MRKSITLLLLLLGFGMGASAVKGQLMITEIMYKSPIGTFNDSLEYIEIYNNTAAPIDMAGYSLAVGVVYTWPANSIVNPGDFVVVCKFGSIVRNYFGQVVPSLPNWGGNLSDTGEPITLRDNNGVTIDSVRYSTTAPWPIGGNGDGHSITFCHHAGDNNDGALWESSSNAFPGAVWQGNQLYGTPGSCCESTDLVAPSLLDYSFPTTSRIKLKFSEPVSESSIWSNNFTGSVGSLTSLRGMTSDSIILNLGTPLTEGQFYSLVIAGVEDTACNMMSNDTLQIIVNFATGNITICEIMYDDPSLDDSLEFIEIMNTSFAPMEVGGFKLGGDLSGVIPPRTLQANERMVVARYPETVSRLFNIPNVIGWETGTLGDAAGSLRLRNDAGLRDSVDYLNTFPWPFGANGTGHSILMCIEGADNSEYFSWDDSYSGDFSFVFQGDSIFATPWRQNCLAIGISDAEEIVNKIYPNPVGSFLSIESNWDEVHHALVFDMTGRQLSSISLPNGTAMIDMSSFPQGLYVVSLCSVDGRKLVNRTVVHD